MNDTSVVISLGALGLGVLLYFLPSFIAFDKNKKNKTAILLLNLFVGWTILGWIGALIWSVLKEE